MKVALNWLRDYVDIDCRDEELAERLTHIGLNLEDLIRIGDETVLDLEVTSNRSDCLGHIGVAREIAAVLEKPLRWPNVSLGESSTRVDDLATVEVLAPELSPRYTARVIQSVKVGPSPDWLVRRLECLGVRSVNNVVDITNYVLFEIGQPLHAFDFDKFAGGEIIVRPARGGEKIVAIDQSEHELNERNLVIADAKRPVAVAGVMGGLDTEVGDRTTTILLESAQFDPLSIRHTARQLNLHSDSSYRFERGVDPVCVEWGSRRAAQLICELAGGTVAAGVIDLWHEPFEAKTISLPMALCRRVLGITIPIDAASDLLKRLAFDVSVDHETLIVTVPSHRRDVTRPIDLVEEVGRLWGFDKVPTDDTIRITAQRRSKLEQLGLVVSESLNQCGFSEAMTISLVDRQLAGLFNEFDLETMPAVTDHQHRANSILRPALLPSLLAAAQHNQDVGNETVDLYELARVYLPNPAGPLPQERRHLALLSGRSFREVRGALEHVLATVDPQSRLTFEPKDYPWFRSDQSARVLLDDEEFGIAGVVDRKLQGQLDLRIPFAVAEIDFDVILERPLEPVRLRPLPRFPAIKRDLSIVVDESVRWDAIERAIRELNVDALETIEFGDLFRGKQIPAGKKSLFLNMRFRHSQRSLTHQEVDAHQARIIEVLRKRCKAALRSD